MSEAPVREEVSATSTPRDPPAKSLSRLARFRFAWTERASSRLAISAFLLVLLASLWVRGSFVRESLPYCRHVDEKTWTEIAMRIARDGDLNPHRFTKPSVMVYLTTAGLALGLIRAGSHGEADGPKDLGKRAFPHYRQPRAIEVPKLLFATASVIGLGMAGVCAWVLGRNKWLLAGTSFVGALSAAYFAHSWEYIGADIIGAFFVLATLTHLLVEHLRRREFVKSVGFAVLHGVIAGFALGSKYNLFPIVLPYLVYTWVYRSERQITRSIAFLLATLGGFVISTPYALFTLNEFLEGAVHEARHYATGHRGQFTEAGGAMLVKYLGDLRDSYGTAVLVVAAGGLVAAFKRDFRLALVTFSFPLAFLAYMSTQRVFFARNIVSCHLFVAIAAAIGIAEALALLGRFTERVASLAKLARWKRRAIWGAPVLLFALFGLPWRSAYAMYTQRIESRKVAERLILKTVPAGTEVLVDDDLFMNTSALSAAHKVTTFDEDQKAVLERFLSAPKGSVLIAPLYEGELLKEALQHDAKVLLNVGIGNVHPRLGAEEGDPKLIVLRR